MALSAMTKPFSASMMKLLNSVLASAGPATWLENMVMENSLKIRSQDSLEPHAALQYGPYREGFKPRKSDNSNTVRTLTGASGKLLIMNVNCRRQMTPLIHYAFAA